MRPPKSKCPHFHAIICESFRTIAPAAKCHKKERKKETTAKHKPTWKLELPFRVV